LIQNDNTAHERHRGYYHIFNNNKLIFHGAGKIRTAPLLKSKNMNKICSSPTIEGLTKLINEYYYSTTCYIENMQVFNRNGLIKNGIVKQAKGKYIYYTINNITP